MDGESGGTTAITKLGLGFHLWISSFITMFFAGVSLINKKDGQVETITRSIQQK